MLPLAAFPLLLSQFVPFEAEVANRLAMTPTLDGNVAEEEWDHLADFQGLRSYFQWEPGTLFVAGDVPNGAWARIIVDRDHGKKGLSTQAREWLIGRTPEGLSVMLRRHDVQGRRWERITQEEPLQQFNFSQQTDRWQFELASPSAGELARLGSRLKVRVEPVPVGAMQLATGDMAPVRLAFDRSFGLPDGVRWSPRAPDRVVIPGDTLRIGMELESKLNWEPQQVSMRTVGQARFSAPEMRMPFPSFGRDDVAALSYVAEIHESAPEGYTVLLTEITDAQGQKAIMQTSYLIAPKLVITHTKPEVKPQPDGTVRVFVDVLLRSKSRNSLRGRVKLTAPTGWEIPRGADAPFIIYHSRGTARLRVELRGTPSETPLSIPIEIRMGEWMSSQTLIIQYP